MNRFLTIILLFLLWNSCNNPVQRQFLREVTILDVPDSFEGKPCKETDFHIPDTNHLDHTPMKYIRLNFHIIRKSDGTGNFNEDRGRVFINQVMAASNEFLTDNKKMNLPVGNDTPILPRRYRYVLTPRSDDPNDDGIYFHDDDDYYWMVSKGKHQNNYDRKVFEKYGVQKDTVLNVFVLAHHVDSLKSKTYKADQRGIAFGTWVKVKHWYSGVQDTVWRDGKAYMKSWNRYNAVKLLNHEVGHCMGLRHTWRSNDGCDDTPRNPNCWNKSKTAPCDSLWSNNFMDYNARSSACSPCQIGIIQSNISNKRSKIRKVTIPTWCTLDKKQTIVIRDSIDWNGAKDLEGDLVVEDGACLTVRCRLSLPEKGKIIIKPKGKLILDGAEVENACGKKWKGIEVWSADGKKGTLDCINSTVIRDATNEIAMIPHQATSND